MVISQQRTAKLDNTASQIQRKVRALASSGQTEGLASVIVYRHHKHPKYLGTEFNPRHCPSHNFFMGI